MDDNPGEWDVYAPALTYAYNMQVHRTTGTRPFDLVLSRLPPEFTLRQARSVRTTNRQDRDRVTKLRDTINKARSKLMKTQARYKFNFDKRTRKVRDKPKVGGWIYLDPDDGTKKRPKTQHSVLGPFKAIQVDERTVMIQQDEVVERVAIDRVAPAPAPESDAPVHYPEAPTAADMQKKKIDGETWLVESLDDHRKTGRCKTLTPLFVRGLDRYRCLVPYLESQCWRWARQC